MSPEHSKVSSFYDIWRRGPVVGGDQWQAVGQPEGSPGRKKPSHTGQGTWQRSVHESSSTAILSCLALQCRTSVLQTLNRTDNTVEDWHLSFLLTHHYELFLHLTGQIQSQMIWYPLYCIEFSFLLSSTHSLVIILDVLGSKYVTMYKKQWTMGVCSPNQLQLCMTTRMTGMAKNLFWQV